VLALDGNLSGLRRHGTRGGGMGGFGGDVRHGTNI
jgi:hypothetical protein